MDFIGMPIPNQTINNHNVAVNGTKRIASTYR